MDSAPHRIGAHAGDQYDALGVAATSRATTRCCRSATTATTTIITMRIPPLRANVAYLADKEEYETGACQEVREGDATKPTGCHWNTAWNQFLVGGG